jgi:hypothetical protein
MKRLLIFFALIACSGWSAPAWAQKPRLEKMTFRLNGKTVTCTIGNAKISMTLVFNTPMQKKRPSVKFGLNEPISLNVPMYDTTWVDERTFFANFDINGDVPSSADGLYKFLVSGAVSTGEVAMEPTRSDTLKNADGDDATLRISRAGRLTASANKVDFGTIKAGASFDKTLTVKNVTCADIFITRFTLSDPFVLLEAPIGAKISADASLTLKLRLSSLTRKTHAGTIKINFTSNQQQDSILVQLAGVTRGPEMVFVPAPSLNFGAIVVGDSATKTFRLTNREALDETLTDTLKIFSATLNPAVGYTLSSLGSFIAPGDTKTVSIQFKPVEGKAYNSSLEFTTNDLLKPLGKISFPVTGVGQLKTPPPKVDTLLVTWPGGRAGYTNTDFLTICLNVDIADVQDARWKFWPTPVPPVSPNDTTGTARFSVLNGKPCFKIPLRNVLSAGRWNCYIWLQGKNGVSGYQTPNYSQLYYDVAAPVFTKAPSVTVGWTGGFTGYTNADNLTVCWEASDSSGISEVRWKFTTTRVRPQSPDDTTKFGGVLRQSDVKCATIPLKLKGLTEGRWYCYLWLVDGSGNSSYLNAYETPLVYDVTAPAAPGEPISRSIPPNDWFSARRNPLTLTLALANGIRDAARVRWKFQTKPQAATLQDGESALQRTANNVSFSVFFSSPGLCGEDSLFYWLADSAGNTNPVNHSFAGYKFDMCPPVITRLRSGEPIAVKRTAFSDTVKIFDHTKVVWDSVLYRFGGARANEPPRRLRRVPNTKDLFVMDIPADGVTTRGLEYKIFARDSLNNPLGVGPAVNGASVCDDHENNAWQPVRVRTAADGEFRIDKDGNPVAQTSGKDQTSYALYSVPFELDKNAPKEVLEDDLGAYDRSKWRLFEYRPEMAPNGWVEYNSATPTISPFMPGRAFFMIVAEAGKVIDSGAGKTVTTGKKYAIELKKGWNLFSNPFNFPVSRENLTLVNSSIPQDSTRLSIRSYERGWNIDNTIEPWKGYAIYVEPKRPAEKIQLLVCPIATTPRIGKDSAPAVTSEKDWTIQIAATAGTARDTINWVGARSAAGEQYDDFDLVEPPVIGEYVSVYVPNLDWPLHPMKYTADFRPAHQDIYEWPLQVTSNSSAGEVVLEFKGLANLPNDYDAYLVDAAYGMARNLKRNPSYRIVTGAAAVDKSLKLLVGKPEALRKQTGGLALVPKAFELSQNFPNPFAAKPAQSFTAIRYALPKSAIVSVEVYNMLGQKVRTLVNRQMQAADYYLATWNGRDEAGKEVSSGIYVYRILAESEGERFASTKKLLLVK